MPTPSVSLFCYSTPSPPMPQFLLSSFDALHLASLSGTFPTKYAQRTKYKPRFQKNQIKNWMDGGRCTMKNRMLTQNKITFRSHLFAIIPLATRISS